MKVRTSFEEKVYSVSKYHNDHTFTWPRETTTDYSNQMKNIEPEQVQKFTIIGYLYKQNPVWNWSGKL